jgi:ankyrin repeat protein
MLLVRTYEAGLLDAQDRARCNGKSALMWASKLGMVSIVHKLLDLSACVELTDEDGMTALMLAAANRQEKAAEILLTPTLTADASLLETRDSNCGRSVLMFSSMSGLTGFCSLLLSCGARPELLDNNNATSLMLALQHATAGIDALADILLAPTANAGLLDVQDITAQRSALHRASSQGLSGIVKKLLDLNANPALTDKDGNTPLLLAITHGHTAAADVLLVPSAQAGMLQVQGAGKMSALCRACEQGLAGIVERLLDLDANPALTDKDGNTPLILAIVHGHAAAAEKLLSQKAQVVALDVQSAGSLRSAIMRASERGMVAMVEKLLSMGAKVGLKDKYGKTALILALENSHEAVAEILLPQTAQAGALDVQGTGYLDRKSALMISSKLGLSSTAEKLLRLHANAKLKDSQGKTALDLARENGHEACVSLLQLHARPV